MSGIFGAPPPLENTASRFEAASDRQGPTCGKTAVYGSDQQKKGLPFGSPFCL
jgi:hypothetical protein